MRIGILGAGDMGHTHARVYAGMPDVEIAGIVGRSRQRVEGVAGEVNAPALFDPWVMLDDDSIEAIDVTFPSALHREWAVAALERGKHVFCETPMALSLEDDTHGMNGSMKVRVSSRARKVAISLPEDLYEEGERERQELGMSRSEYIASLYRAHQDERKLQRKNERYRAAYAQAPASAEEDALTESSERVLAESS